MTLSFDGDSQGLKATQIVPTLDTPIEKGKNVIWCATFAAGWKQLQQKVTNGPVNLTDAAEVCARLNAAPDPAPTMPPEAFYANAGTADKGIVEAIQQDMRKQFPDHRLRPFDGILPGSFVLYSYLRVRVPFKVPYFDNREPLVFTDSSGVATEVRSFGLRKEDGDRYGSLRRQARYIMEKWGEGIVKGHPQRVREEFAIDLCADSSPCQIVVARVPLAETLAAIVDGLDRSIAAAPRTESGHGLGGNDILLVPDMFWKFEHHFRELENRALENQELSGQSVSVALQDIQFRLDKSGAELWSESQSHWASAPAVDPILDGPFLLYIKKRGEAMPFFVMWIDNAELLQRWGS
ncbi:MAG: hypothetical protein HZB26_08475 [Candidatus Hydrogenedentes bacterium]|nr:hypothetical protein [Candidatus Hydrogenedentota bacterium]